MATQTCQSQPSITLVQAGAMAGAVALGCYTVYGLTQKTDFKIRKNQSGHHTANTTPENAEIVRSRVSKTYKYLLGSLASTAASSYFLFKMGFARRIMHNPGPWMFATFVSSVITMIGTRLTSYEKDFKKKHIYWTLFNASIGSSVCMLGYVGGSILIQSLLYTSMLMGGISMVAMSAPNNFFLGMGSFLSVGLSLLNGFALIQWFYPNYNLTNWTVPFSLGLFGLYTAYDTQKVLHNAQDLSVQNEYDPINEQMDLYLDSINVFIDITKLLIQLQKEEDDDNDKEKKQKRN